MISRYGDSMIFNGTGMPRAFHRRCNSRVAGFLDWLATGPDLRADGDPLTQPVARDIDDVPMSARRGKVLVWVAPPRASNGRTRLANDACRIVDELTRVRDQHTAPRPA